VKKTGQKHPSRSPFPLWRLVLPLLLAAGLLSFWLFLSRKIKIWVPINDSLPAVMHAEIQADYSTDRASGKTALPPVSMDVVRQTLKDNPTFQAHSQEIYNEILEGYKTPISFYFQLKTTPSPPGGSGEQPPGKP
jgi:hypothetical protein